LLQPQELLRGRGFTGIRSLKRPLDARKVTRADHRQHRLRSLSLAGAPWRPSPWGLQTPALATLATFTFLYAWNSFFWPLVVINTGNANAGTGAQCLHDAQATFQALAQVAGIATEAVLPFSTGVIGEPLPVAKIVAAIPAALTALSQDGWAAAARGIMTTDTRPKGCSRTLMVHGHAVTVTGIAKGAGMIRPDMATMLAYIATDAAVTAPCLQAMLQQAVDASFNRITVDGDTSTNDACVLLATGAAGNRPLEQSEDAPALQQAITEVCLDLAQAIVRDAEGATKFVTVDVGGGRDTDECLAVAYAIAQSPLVKTALFASDPNWGRLLAAIGRAGLADLDIGGIDVFLGDVLIAAGGARAASYTEEQGAAVMREEDILIRVELGRGAARERVWTCDFSYDYVRINAEYRS
jgi:glutamate N-acetyltransferase/amino-acid N-acetyltransferase